MMRTMMILVLGRIVLRCDKGIHSKALLLLSVELAQDHQLVVVEADTVPLLIGWYRNFASRRVVLREISSRRRTRRYSFRLACVQGLVDVSSPL